MQDIVEFLLKMLLRLIGEVLLDVDLLFKFLTVCSPFRLMRKLCLAVPLREMPDGALQRVGLWFLDLVSWAALVICSMQTFKLIVYVMAKGGSQPLG